MMPGDLVRQKLKAVGIHFAVSLFVLASFLAYVYFILYTPIILRLEGGFEIALLILLVDITLGPLMTLILYRKGKPGLAFDIAVVLVIQIGAFIYGASSLVIQRPAYIAHTVDRFDIVPHGDLIEESKLQDPSLAPGLFTGPRVVFVQLPKGAEMNDITFQAISGGKDIQYYREYYRPFAEHLNSVRDRAFSLDAIRHKQPATAATVEQALKRLGRTEEEVLLVPVIGFARDGAAIIDAQSGDILDYVDHLVWWGEQADKHL